MEVKVMTEKTKDFIWWGGLALAAVLIISNKVDASEIQDHYKDIISQKPYTVEVCRDRVVSGDKTGDALAGAIIGGILGNNIKGEKDGGAIGAIIGGMLGHSNSGVNGGVKTYCSNQTRYKEESRTVYSHSTITFEYEGKVYKVRFKK